MMSFPVGEFGADWPHHRIWKVMQNTYQTVKLDSADEIWTKIL